MILRDFSYIINHRDEDIKRRSEIVTASSTIVDEQGIVKSTKHPRSIRPYPLFYYPLINQRDRNEFSTPRNYLLEVPIINEKKSFQRDFSIVFSWSMPLKTHVLQLPTRSSRFVQNINTFERDLMKISIATNSCPSEIALSNSEDTLDSLPTSLVKNKRIDSTEHENCQKRFCFNRSKLTNIDPFLLQRFSRF